MPINKPTTDSDAENIVKRLKLHGFAYRQAVIIGEALMFASQSDGFTERVGTYGQELLTEGIKAFANLD